MKKFGTPTVVGEKPSSAVASDALGSVAGEAGAGAAGAGAAGCACAGAGAGAGAGVEAVGAGAGCVGVVAGSAAGWVVVGAGAGAGADTSCTETIGSLIPGIWMPFRLAPA